MVSLGRRTGSGRRPRLVVFLRGELAKGAAGAPTAAAAIDSLTSVSRRGALVPPMFIAAALGSCQVDATGADARRQSVEASAQGKEAARPRLPESSAKPAAAGRDANVPHAGALRSVPEPSATEGDWVTLWAHGAHAVPVHAAEGDSAVVFRVESGIRARVLERTQHDSWLRVELPAGRRGWIAHRYVGHNRAGALPTAAVSEAWHSRTGCESVLQELGASPRPSGVARVATWNLRWFPDGAPGAHSPEGTGTDLQWTACAIALLGIDVLGVQEFKRSSRAREALERVTERLDAATGGRWTSVFDDCPNPHGQHVGFIYDASRIENRETRVMGSLNPRGGACEDQHRPGLAAYWGFPGGYDGWFVVMHAKSGTDEGALRLRQTTVEAMNRVAAELTAARGDSDVVFLGDFNTMGCSACSPHVSAAEETARLAELLARGRPALRLLHQTPGCSTYYRGRAVLLDQVVTVAAMREIPPGSVAFDSGICGDLTCRQAPRESEREATRALSDHCPVVLQFTDRDWD